MVKNQNTMKLIPTLQYYFNMKGNYKITVIINGESIIRYLDGTLHVYEKHYLLVTETLKHHYFPIQLTIIEEL